MTNNRGGALGTPCLANVTWERPGHKFNDNSILDHGLHTIEENKGELRMSTLKRYIFDKCTALMNSMRMQVHMDRFIL